MSYGSKLFFPHDGKQEHFEPLDGLRGIAVLFVMLSHASRNGMHFHESLNFRDSGKIGVYLFFVLSAYLLDRQIAIALMSKKSSVKYWLNYFLRRFLRIFPLFLIALLFFCITYRLGIPFKKWEIIQESNIIPHLLLQEGRVVFWSIAVEFKYYFLSPFIMYFCHKVLKWNLKLVVLLIFCFIGFQLLYQRFYSYDMLSTMKYITIFLTGTLFSIYELLKKEILTRPKTSIVLDIMGFLTIGIIICSIPHFLNSISGININPAKMVYFLPYAILWVFLLISSKYGHGSVRRVLKFKPLRFIGTISYSMYLFNYPIAKFYSTNVLEFPNELRIYLFFITTILISMAGYLLVERPMSKIRIFRNRLTEESIQPVP